MTRFLLSSHHLRWPHQRTSHRRGRHAVQILLRCGDSGDHQVVAGPDNGRSVLRIAWLDDRSVDLLSVERRRDPRYLRSRGRAHGDLLSQKAISIDARYGVSGGIRNVDGGAIRNNGDRLWRGT